MELHNIKSAYSLANTLYSISMDPNDFEDVALNGWELIGNKHSELVKEVLHPQGNKVKVPCGAIMIESVHLPCPDYQTTSSSSNTILFENAYTERYSDQWKWNTDPLYTDGKLVKYRWEDGYLHFDQNYDTVLIAYHKLITDDEGLPKISDAEIRAIAAYVAYVDTFKQGLARKDGNTLQLASVIEQKWLKLCSAARIPNKITQNDMDAMLDAHTRWDRKVYRKSYKPVN